MVFLGVRDFNFQPSFEIKNPNHIARSEFLRRQLARSDSFAKFIARSILKPAYISRIRKTIEMFNTKVEKRPPLPPKTVKSLRAELRPGVERLSDLLGRDLISLWGYK